MVCKKCGNQISENSKFCNNCGCNTKLLPKKTNISKILIPILSVVIVVLIVLLVLISLHFMNSKQPTAEQEITQDEVKTNAEKIIGEWIVVGETDEVSKEIQYIPDESNYHISFVFNDDNTLLMKFKNSESIPETWSQTEYTYRVTYDGYIKMFDENGEPSEHDYKITWNGDELILAEYWYEGYFDTNGDYIRDIGGPYNLEDDHDAIVLKKKK